MAIFEPMRPHRDWVGAKAAEESLIRPKPPSIGNVMFSSFVPLAMDLIAAVVTLAVFVGFGYAIVRSYWLGTDHGLNRELFD
jgi:apolipoprotein N-acyltransferase